MSSGRTVQQHRVVITGLGAITPIGQTLLEIENSLREAKSGVHTITRFDASTRVEH